MRSDARRIYPGFKLSFPFEAVSIWSVGWVGFFLYGPREFVIIWKKKGEIFTIPNVRETQNMKGKKGCWKLHQNIEFLKLNETLRLFFASHLALFEKQVHLLGQNKGFFSQAWNPDWFEIRY